MTQASPDTSELRVVLVTGPAGAGRSTAIRALEDVGYEAIDNLPLSMVPRLVTGPPIGRPIALGIDPRNRDFGTVALNTVLSDLRQNARIAVEILYLDCSTDVLLRRYSETRRRHPSAPDAGPEIGIARERDLLDPVRQQADVLIDTSDLSVHDLKARIQHWFAAQDSETLAVTLHSFSYKLGLPHVMDTVFDCRFLRNPYWDRDLRPLNGLDPRVQAYVQADPMYEVFFTHLKSMILALLPAYRAEGKAHLSIGFGCTGGQHRSVTVTETLAKALAESGWQVSIRHREIERRAASLHPVGGHCAGQSGTAGKGETGHT